MTIRLGIVGHFGLAVHDPSASARWWRSLFDLHEIFRDEDVVGLSNEHVTIVLHRGKPSPQTLGHMSFHVPNMRALRSARDAMRSAQMNLEDPGDEIGPEAPGSPHLGLWFRDPDGYRWELSVQNGATTQ